MQRSAVDKSVAADIAGSRSALFPPTSIDRVPSRAPRVILRLSRASDLSLVGIAALLALVDIALWATDPVVDTGRIPMSVAFLVPCLGVFAAVALALRRRHLALALVALAGSGMVLTIAGWSIGTNLPPSFAALFALALLTSSTVRRAHAGTAIAHTTLAACATAAEALRPMVSAAAYLLVLCEGAFSVAVGVGVYLRWADWQHVAAEDAARADERLEIAREVHDLVGHYVTAIVVQAQAARHVAGRQPAAASAALESIERAGTDAMAAMRRLVGGLRDDSPVTPRETWSDVDQLVADAVARGGPVRASIDPDVKGVAPTLAPAVHRIISESLTNMQRHAHEVTRVDVAVFRRDDRLVLTVHDDGLVAVPMGMDTFGIVGMRERAVSLGGSLSAGPAPGGGWTVHAELPMDHPL